MPRKLPRLSYSATVWENFIRNKGGQVLASNLNQQIAINLRAMIQAGSYIIQGLPGREPSSSQAVSPGHVPTMPSNFDFCAPQEKTLPISQTKLNEWQATLTLVQPALDQIVQEHNAAVNPGGVPFKPNTRPAPVPIHKLPGATAVRMPTLPGQAADTDALAAAGGLTECQVSNQPQSCTYSLS